MKDLLKTPHDFETNASFTGRFVGLNEDNQFLFEDQKGLPTIIPNTVHTKKGVDQIEPGDVVMVKKSVKGFDLFLLEGDEITEWEKIRQD